MNAGNARIWTGNARVHLFARGVCFEAAPVCVVRIRKHLPAPHASRQAGGHVLTPGRFVGAEAVKDDGEPFEEKMKRLMATLREQQAETACLRRRFGRQAKLDAATAKTSPLPLGEGLGVRVEPPRGLMRGAGVWRLNVRSE